MPPTPAMMHLFRALSAVAGTDYCVRSCRATVLFKLQVVEAAVHQNKAPSCTRVPHPCHDLLKRD
eukprot:5435482-Amphidinium_carterae.1